MHGQLEVLANVSDAVSNVRRKPSVEMYFNVASEKLLLLHFIRVVRVNS